MSIRPILSTLSRHRIAAGLIVAEVALALAFVTNALHMISVRLERLHRETGIAEQELVNLDLRVVAPIKEADALTAEDLRQMRALPGVKSVSVANQIIYGNSNSVAGVSNKPGQEGERVGASHYRGDEHFIATMGLKIVMGRNFLPEEVQPSSAPSSSNVKVPVLIINRALADAMYPGQNAVGKPLWAFDGTSTIIGVVESLPHTNPSASRVKYALIAPVKQTFRNGTYLLRVEPGMREQVLKQATAVTRAVDPRRTVGRGATLTDMRDKFFAEDRAMTLLLFGVCAALLAVTGFGIVGLASFWVAQRTRMIGVRRALGATQAQIRQYFQLENLLLCAAGVLLGAAGAVALSQFFIQPQGAPALPLMYLPIGAALLLLLGQLAVLAPARKAAALPAAIAVRV
jgi:putative ABC transport system permease protein